MIYSVLKTIFLFNFLSIVASSKSWDRLHGSHSRGEQCVKYYEWTLDEDMVINDKQYYGFKLDGSTGTFTLPVYDNLDLENEPVARLRGSMITDTGGFTANAAMYFYEDDAYTGVHVSYAYDPALEEDFVYGYTVGGTGKFASKRYRDAEVTSVVVAEEPKFIVEWTFCYF